MTRIYVVYKRSTSEQNTYTDQKQRVGKITFQANEQGKKSGFQYLFQTINFKTKAIKRDKEGRFIILKGRIYQEVMNIVNIYGPTLEHPGI